MEENARKKLKNKGYICNCKHSGKCKFFQINKLGIKEWILPNLKSEERIGVIEKLAVINEKIKDKKNKPIETVETETTVLKKHAFWYEATGIKDELIVALEQSKKILSSIEKVEENLEFIKFVSKEDEELNEYAKKVILVGIRNLFKLGEIHYWDKFIYIIWNTNSTGKSSGSALLLAFYSAYYEIEISDSFSITGQIEDDGNISKIGGVKEKIIKAIRDKKIKNLILPQENHEKALKILDKYYKKYSVSEKLNLYPVSHWKDLIKLLFQQRDDRLKN